MHAYVRELQAAELSCIISHSGRNGVQKGSNFSPQSRLVFIVCFLISIASSTLLFQYLGSCCTTSAPSQSTSCLCSFMCAAMPFMFPYFTAYLCSISLFCRFLLVSPIYAPSQSKHGTLYTTPFFSRSGWGVFTFVRIPRSVP